ncbi:MAG: sensor domain-containing diguanylate cyclase [Chloroherpetonaceae bacterium]|nr:sensor domain-containing diguanylate cyclase [Chthonomonadaceae bacterium]MDW8207818.1 sensor domain-containing diguanylate cyclase [Chloroherpetonaceae bacterium]
MRSEPVRGYVLWWRLTLWLAMTLLAYVAFAGRYPMAWPVALFGVMVTLVWPLLRALPASAGDDLQARDDAASPPDLSIPLATLLEISLDLLTVTALVHVTGGFQSAFAPLYFLIVLETFALLGPRQAICMAAVAALLNLVHFRLGVTPQAAALYGVATGTLLLSAALVLWTQCGTLNPVRRSTLLKQRTLEVLEEELAESHAALEHLKSNYRELAQISREQKAQLDRLTIAEQLYTVSATMAVADGNASEACAHLLRIVADRMEAGGAALWMVDTHTDVLRVQALEGRVAPTLRDETCNSVTALTPADLRAWCEERLLTASPIAETTSPEAMPVVVVLLRDPADGERAGTIMGAVGICDPRGAARFTVADAERLQTIAHPLAVALTNAAQRGGLQRRVRELSLLYELSRLVQSSTDLDQLYQAIITQIQQVIPYENATLFLLDRARKRLEPKATQGRVVNLLDHIAFEKGAGLSGWVAARGKQIVIPDLQKEPNLLNVEMIPPRVRSFISMPLRVQNNVVGVINLSHSRPNAFSPEDVQLLTILAAQAAITIERTEVFHTMELLAITDGLTQIYNHRYFHRRLEDEIKRGRRYKTVHTLLMVDIDRFKAINDRFGHTTGDAILRDLAALLRRSVRETEIVARYGGEEFAIILTQTDLEQGMIAAERVRASVEAQTFTTVDGQPLSLTVSIGVAAFPRHARNASDLLEQADRALYTAKREGRNRVCVATPATS